MTKDIPTRSAAARPHPSGDQPREATTGLFYSISNTQKGLGGISFGNFLIKQVVEELKQDLPNLQTFVTLSPVPAFAGWLKHERESDNSLLDAAQKDALMLLDTDGWWQDEPPSIACTT